MKELILSPNNPKEYVAINWEDGISFVQNNETGKNFFSNKTIGKCTGLTKQAVSHHWVNFKKLNTNEDISVTLKILNIDKPVEFKTFEFFIYIIYRADTPKCIMMREKITSILIKKYSNIKSLKYLLSNNNIDSLSLIIPDTFLRGIYKIVCHINKRVYIGLSQDCNERLSQHKTQLINNKHSNNLLQEDFNKYGINNFSFNVIYEADTDESLNELEMKFVKDYKSNLKKYGYNMNKGGGSKDKYFDSTKKQNIRGD
jgi:hypothetical protein